jgi:biopolymer transport protein ExbB/TolQ
MSWLWAILVGNSRATIIGLLAVVVLLAATAGWNYAWRTVAEIRLERLEGTMAAYNAQAKAVKLAAQEAAKKARKEQERLRRQLDRYVEEAKTRHEDAPLNACPLFADAFGMLAAAQADSNPDRVNDPRPGTDNANGR